VISRGPSTDNLLAICAVRTIRVFISHLLTF
jgi:hypothetical protein